MSKKLRIAAALGVALATAGVPGLADDTIPTGTSIAAPFSTLQSPQFAMSSVQGLSNLYGSCFMIGAGTTGNDSLTQALTKLIVGNNGGSGSSVSCAQVNTKSCTPIVPNGSPSCTDNSDGSFDKDAFDKLIGQAQSNQCCADAKVSALQQANQELGCIGSQDQALQSQIQSLAPTFQQNLQTAQSNVSQIDQTVADRVSQTSFLNDKLQGDKNSSGLLAIQKQMASVVPNQMPAQEQALETANIKWQKDEQLLPQKIEARRMALADQCFAQTASVKCSLTSQSDCTYEQYAIAEYYQDVRSNGGQIDTSGDVGSPTSQGLAQGEEGGLQAALSNILVQVPTQINISPATQAEAQADQAQAGELQILTPAQFDSLVISKLSAFNLPGFNVAQFVEDAFNQCYNTVLSQNDQETTDAIDALNVEQNNVSQSANTFLTQYAGLYSQVWDAFGVTASLNLSQCQNTSTASISTNQGQVTGTVIPVSQELQCARDVEANLQALWLGTSQASQVNVNVPASNQSNAFSFTCYGINGCVTSMKNAVSNLTSATQSLDQYKKQYIQQVNNNVNNMVTQVQQMLGGQSMLLQQQLNQLKTSLANEGVTAQLTFPAVQPQKLTQANTTDSTGQSYPGLYQMPDANQLLGVLAGGLNPPLPDPSQDSFEQAQAQIAQQMQQDQQTDQQIASDVNDLKQQEQKCEQDASKQGVQTAEQAVQTYITQCVQNQPCPTSGSSPLATLTSLVDSLSPGTAQTDLTTILSTGQNNACGNGGTSALENLGWQADCQSAAHQCSWLTIQTYCGTVLVSTSDTLSSDNNNCNTTQVSKDWKAAVKTQTANPAQNCGMLSTNATSAVRSLQDSDSNSGDSDTSAD